MRGTKSVRMMQCIFNPSYAVQMWGISGGSIGWIYRSALRLRTRWEGLREWVQFLFFLGFSWPTSLVETSSEISLKVRQELANVKPSDFINYKRVKWSVLKRYVLHNPSSG